MSRISLLFRSLLIVTLVLATSGCKTRPGTERLPVHPVSGKLTYQGKPAVGALVVLNFVNENPITKNLTKPHGIVQADGSFKISMYEAGDGAPAGDYVVTVSLFKPGSGDDEERGELDAYGGRFLNPGTSQIKVTVKEGENILPPIDLK